MVVVRWCGGVDGGDGRGWGGGMVIGRWVCGNERKGKRGTVRRSENEMGKGEVT
jgi:hypothetical protein